MSAARPFRIGATVLRLRQRFEHGLRVAYYRDVIRPRILRTPPVTTGEDDRCEIHVLTSGRDWLNLVWGLKTFYYYAGRRYGLCIHEDGSVTDETCAALARHFPGARIIRRSEADAAVLERLRDYPRCLAFRRDNLLAPKLFDFAHFLRSERLLLLDSDVLFFSKPAELLRRIEDERYRMNSVNRDVATAYTVEPSVVQATLGLAVVDRFNSGLGLIHRASLRIDWIEEFLALPDIHSHFWRTEQTLFALLSSRYGVELLPPEYDVHVEGSLGAAPCRHYIGRIRHRLYGEGLRTLARGGFPSAAGRP